VECLSVLRLERRLVPGDVQQIVGTVGPEFGRAGAAVQLPEVIF
jgi:hypothetical protein